MYNENYIHPLWLSEVYNPIYFKEILKFACKNLKRFRRKYPFDAFAITGMSGALFGGALSCATQIPFILVRKEEDDTSSRFCVDKSNVSGYFGFKKYIIVDDLVCSGNTLCRIYEEISHWKPGTELVGVAVYNKYYATSEIQPDQSPIGRLPLCQLWRTDGLFTKAE